MPAVHRPVVEAVDSNTEEAAEAAYHRPLFQLVAGMLVVDRRVAHKPVASAAHKKVPDSGCKTDHWSSADMGRCVRSPDFLGSASTLQQNGSIWIHN